MDKVKIGIAELDEYIGGFHEGRSVLVTGNAGSGKTIFALQFAASSCAQGLKTVYMSTEENSVDLRLQAKAFNFDFESYEKEGLLNFVDMSFLRYEEWGPLMNLRLVVNKGKFSELLKDVPKGTQTFILDSIGGYVSQMP